MASGDCVGVAGVPAPQAASNSEKITAPVIRNNILVMIQIPPISIELPL
jgi:hypothetical protein